MSDIKITVVVDGDDQVLNYELAPSTTVADLKSFVAAETEKPEASQILLLNGSPLTNGTQSIEQAGIKTGDLLTAATSNPQRAAPQPPQSSQPQANDEIEQLRQRILSDPAARSQISGRSPQLANALNDPGAFREAFAQIEQERRQQMAQYESRLQSLNEDVNEENQREIEERIRMENIEREMDEVMNSNPELFGRVTMLYIQVEINGHPVKAFVDSGAQTTIISPSCAEACNITRLIDTRWSGVARGVGTAKILGRIHKANVKIGYDEVTCGFTVMEGKDVDMLLGLDMLKRYQACIDLNQNRLVFPGGQSVPFLGEADIPKGFEEAMQNEPTVAGPGGTSIGAETGTIRPPATASSSSAAAGSSARNFRGQGQTLGSAAPQPAVPPTAAPTRTAAPPRAPQFPQSSIDTLTGLGATREQAIQALQAAGGNVELAAGIFFGS